MKGFVALSTILVLSAVMLVVVGTITYLAIGEAQTSLALSLGSNSLDLVEGCTEDLLQKVHDDGTYAGAAISRPEGTCAITYNPGTTRPTNWDVTVSSDATEYQRKIQVIFTRSSSAITLSSWQEN